jgi:hypothetical protein
LSLYQGFGPLGARLGALELSLELDNSPGCCCLDFLRGSHLRCIGLATSAWCGCSGWAPSEPALSFRLAPGGEVRRVETLAPEQSSDLAGRGAALRRTEDLLLVGERELAPLGCGWHPNIMCEQLSGSKNGGHPKNPRSPSYTKLRVDRCLTQHWQRGDALQVTRDPDSVTLAA